MDRKDLSKLRSLDLPEQHIALQRKAARFAGLTIRYLEKCARRGSSDSQTAQRLVRLFKLVHRQDFVTAHKIYVALNTKIATMDIEEILRTRGISAMTFLILESLIETGKDDSVTESFLKSHLSKMARKAAMNRHAENHAVKADVFAWCQQNLEGKTIDGAAEEISGKIFNIKFRTAQKYISEYRKSLHPARRV